MLAAAGQITTLEVAVAVVLAKILVTFRAYLER
jgi:hypothetical protein